MTDNKHHKPEGKVAYRDILRFALHYWGQRKAVGIAAAAAMMTAVAADSLVPVYSGRMVDALTMPGVTAEASLHAALAAFIGFAGLSFINLLARFASFGCWNFFAVRNLYQIVTDGMYKVQRFSADWHANSFAGGTVRKITRGMWAFDQFEDTLLMGLLPAITVMASVTITLSSKLPLVGIAAFVLILCYCALSIWLSVSVLAPRHKASAEMDTKMGATLADAITGNPTVKSFGAEKREDTLFRSVATLWRDKALHAWQSSALAEAVRSTAHLMLTAIIILLTGHLWMQGEATPGDLVLVITTCLVVGGYLRDIGRNISQLQRAISDMEDAVSFWMRQDDVVDAPDAKPLVISGAARSDLISFDRVRFAYAGGGAPLYEDLSLDIRSGEKLALVGPSGSGKSTFVKLLQRLYNVNGGRILVDGQDIAQVTLESLRQTISLVPQDPILFHRSLADNIAYGRPGADMESIVAAAKKSFAHDFIMALPQGYDTLVGERGVKLSGGERQRVAIARAILSDSPVLILDEATSSLDSISEHYIQLALAALMKGRTTITIAHRLSTIQQADRILVFDRGRIVEQGSHAALMANPDSHYKKLFEMQVLAFTDPNFKPPV